MIVLDTNVISELMRPAPSPVVIDRVAVGARLRTSIVASPKMCQVSKVCSEASISASSTATEPWKKSSPIE